MPRIPEERFTASLHGGLPGSTADKRRRQPYFAGFFLQYGIFGEFPDALRGAFRTPENQREAVLLHYFYGYKKREIARMTGASYEAVKSRIRQGLRKLRKEISFS